MQSKQQIVLVVDDNEDNRVIFATSLKSRGYAVALAKNGAEAVEAVAAIRPAAVLMDIHMPVMNGIEATRTLKSDPSLRSIPVIAVSAYDVHDSDLRHAGFCAFLPKPVAPSFLAHAVAICIASAAKSDGWIRVGPMEVSP